MTVSAELLISQSIWRGEVYLSGSGILSFPELRYQQGAWRSDVGKRDRHSTGDLVCGGYRDSSFGVDESGEKASEELRFAYGFAAK